MAEYNFPWSGVTPGNAGPYTAALFRQYSQHLLNNALRPNAGVVFGSGDGINDALDVQETAVASTSVRVRTGAAFVAGGLYITDADVLLPVTANSSGNPRIDLLVLRSNSATQITTPFIIEGTPAGSPVAPSPVRSGSIYDIVLAEIAVSSPFASIVNANIDNTVREYHLYIPVELGGVGLSSSALGDVIVGTGTNTFGTENIGDGKTVVRDLAEANGWNSRHIGLETITPRTVLGSPAAAISITSIPAKYRDLILVIKGKSTNAGSIDLRVQFNSDTGASYSTNQQTTDQAGTVANVVAHNQTSIAIQNGTANNTETASFMPSVELTINQYREVTTRTGWWMAARFGTATGLLRGHGVFGWENVADVISSINLALSSGNFDTGTEYVLYGVGRDS